MVTTKKKPKCPKLYLSWYDQKTKLCQFNSKECLLESGANCPYYGKYKNPST